MISITDYIVNKSGLPLLAEPSDSRYNMFNTGGIECEVGEFLYSLIRMIKPSNILETGTHFGISSSYMGLALKHNKKGKIITLDPSYWGEAKSLHSKLELNEILTQVSIHAEDYVTTEMFDILFLDSEPKLRFNEFDLFFKNVSPGGLIFIHDLHPHLSYGVSSIDHPTFLHWPYGDFREKLGRYIKNNEVQTFSVNTPRGLTIFQKKTEKMSYIKLINGKL